MTHPLKEMNEIGEEIKDAALKITPTLVKYTNYNEYLGKTEIEKIEDIPDDKENVRLVEYDKDAETKILTAILYKNSNLTYNQVKQKVKDMNDEDRQSHLKKAVGKMEKFDVPLREFEHTFYTFDVLVDYGAFRDIQRHRMMTQTNQDLTPAYGFEIPKDVYGADLEKDYLECMKISKDTYRMIAEAFPNEAQYVLSMAFRKRVLMKVNFRSLFHFIKLRSSEQGHDSYRKIAQDMYKCVNVVQPFLGSILECNLH